MKHPKGSLKTIFELKEAAVPGTVFYLAFGSEPYKTFKFTIPKGFKVHEDHVNRKWTFVVDTIDLDTKEEYGTHKFWSPYGDLHFPTTADKCGFLFNNYWHAYAYLLKLGKAA